jgi:predicted RNase H-like nuclease (RuvC/YqgF family)
MSMEDMKQGRRLFGRRSDGADAEVEMRVRAAEERAHAAEARIGDLQAELVFYGDAIRSLRGELETMTERVVSRVAPQVVELEARNAETEALRETVENMRAEAYAERERLLEWRRQTDGAMSSLQGEIERARRAIDEMPERIREALTPAAQAMQTVGAGMAILAGMSIPPSELQGDREVSSEPWSASGGEYEWQPEPQAEQQPEPSYEGAEPQGIDLFGPGEALLEGYSESSPM